MGKAASTTVGVMVGGALGAITALLLAPKRGEETRGDVARWTRERQHKAADSLRAAGHNVADTLREIPSKVAEKAPEIASRVKDRIMHRGEEHPSMPEEETDIMAHPQ